MDLGLLGGARRRFPRCLLVRVGCLERRFKLIAEDSKDATGENAGPLPEPQRSQVADKLTHAEGIIDGILDPNKNPSLNPTDAGSVDRSVNPSTLPQNAQTCFDLAQQAHAEAGQAAGDHQVIGTNIKTIKSLLPKYRQLAGIT